MSLRTKWIALALAFLMTICSSLVGRADLAQADTQYVVHKGDTLWHIAKTHHTSVSNLIHTNHLTSTFIQVHQTLTIPDPNKSSPGTSPTHSEFVSTKHLRSLHASNVSVQTTKVKVHTVQAGDTLWHIALVNHTTVSSLMNINHLRSDIIYPGQKLKVSVQSQPQATYVRSQTYKSVGLPLKLIPVYRSAGAKYGIPWTILAAIHRVETHFGTGYAVSSAGAEGPMQFMPATFRAYAVRAPGQKGKPNINNVYDAIYTAAHMLAADGFANNPTAALYHYNHSFAYVAKVMRYARLYKV